MDSSHNVLRGRPYGGLAILWRKTLGGCKIISTQSNRLMCIQITSNNKTLTVFNVYMPCEDRANVDDYLDILSQFSAYVEQNNTLYAAMLGDFNANYQPSNASSSFYKELSHFCEEENYYVSDVRMCDASSFTFYSEAHKTTSWIDHLISNVNTHSIVKSINILYDYISSDHFPILVNLDINRISLDSDALTNDNIVRKIQWQSLSELDFADYKARTQTNFKNIKLDHSLLLCDNPNCSNEAHINQIDYLYDCVIDMLKTSGDQCIKQKENRRYEPIAGWNEYCSEVHAQARDAFLIWVGDRKPRQGPSFQNMQRTRSIFKQAIRHCRMSESKAYADSLAHKLLTKNDKQFWKAIKSLSGNNRTPLASTVGTASGQKAIAEMWRSHYEQLLNSTPPIDDYENLAREINVCTRLESPISPREVSKAIDSLKLGKACGLDSLQSEHFKYAADKLSVLLSMCFNCMILHGHVPQRFMHTIIAPILKDKKGSITDADNYRPIALTSVSSKIFEYIMLFRLQCFLSTNDNQFGFKPKHSTDMCVFALKQTIDYYMSMSSPMYICYIDASKAFDRINFKVLFTKLLTRGIPSIFVRFLSVWYCTQQLVVRWGSMISAPFNVSNGVRQGGILSPLLFNVYVDDLSNVLNQSGVGCKLNGIIINHLVYADDMVLLAPSARAVQILLTLCELYAKDCFIMYNAKKTVCMCCKPKVIKHKVRPTLVLNGSSLKYVDSHKYLGVTICSDMNDNLEIQSQVRNMYIRGNTVIKNFKKCSDNVKCKLFKSLCANVYCVSLWSKFTQESLRRIQVAYNRVFRVLFCIVHRTSISFELILRRLDPFTVLVRKCIFSFMERIHQSNNILIKTTLNTVYFLFCQLSSRWSYILFNLKSSK